MDVLPLQPRHRDAPLLGQQRPLLSGQIPARPLPQTVEVECCVVSVCLYGRDVLLTLTSTLGRLRACGYPGSGNHRFTVPKRTDIRKLGHAGDLLRKVQAIRWIEDSALVVQGADGDVAGGRARSVQEPRSCVSQAQSNTLHDPTRWGGRRQEGGARAKGGAAARGTGDSETMSTAPAK